ncbi:AraC family transcriptional regulator [Acinetobacter sp.]|uniref:AraC family transcriptional regulator n=1 Tax=Acinetobacter sp. TaxID=472 RepID=UPI002648B6C6|nr:AraC family transcriptional regulator [Acinetobacter sp.]MDN5510871.1 AraC family transcriptional regulator [Acinetobacter sp.]MDN5525549.1 AraC family transcriptional regulator [Acinetobacter sp.]
MKRSILGLMYLIQGMRKAGVAVDQKLQAIGLRADALDPGSIIHPSLEWDVLKVIGQDVAPEKGLFIGQHYALAGYGPLLMLLVTSENVRTALEQGIRYQALTHLTGVLSLKYTAQKVALCYAPEDLNSDLGLLRAQCEISGTYKFIQDLYKMMGLSVPQMHIELPFAQPENLQALDIYHDYYGAELRFAAEYAEFWFDADVLNVQIPSADKMTFKIYESKCIAELDRLKADESAPSLVQRVQDYLELQQGVMPTMAETAQALQIPERTLRHQLQQLQSSYKQIREQLIKDKALRLIEYKEYSIEMIAELLGYSEPAAFNHAFKRWFGHSPRQYFK